MSQTRVWGQSPQPLETMRILGRSHQLLSDLLQCFGKNNYFNVNAIWITFRTFLEPFERTTLLRFESQLKSCNCLACLYLQVKPKTRLKSYIFGLNFVSDLAQFEGSKVQFVGLHVRPGGSGPLNSNLIISPISISPS